MVTQIINHQSKLVAIPTFIISLRDRVDRRAHILKEFDNKPEFDINIIDAIKHQYGAMGLWQTIKHIITRLVPPDAEYILLCEDDHQFTDHYSYEALRNAIDKAITNNADLISGGISWVQDILHADKSLYWISAFTGLQFTIIFRSFFSKILSANFAYNEDADFKISALASKKLLLYPFISTQKEFGYSDVTIKNAEAGRVARLFRTSSERIRRLKEISDWYAGLKTEQDSSLHEEMLNFTLPTYILSSREASLPLEAELEFRDRDEFCINIVKKNDTSGNEGLIYTADIVNIIERAIEREEEVVIICDERHRFTKDYEVNKFLTTLINVYNEGGSLLLGNAKYFSNTSFANENRWWIDSFSGCSFMVVYKDIFNKILNASQSQFNNTEHLLGDMILNKTLLYPFISRWNEEPSNDVSDSSNNEKGINHDASFRLNRLSGMQTIF